MRRKNETKIKDERKEMTKAVKTRLYTFEEMREVVAKTSSQIVKETLKDEELDDPFKCMIIEMAVVAKILGALDEKHEKGEI